jgi:MFS superfamily sulfate permease-like transporter
VGVVVLILLFLAPLISLMPEATLGAMLLLAGRGLINTNEFRNMAQIRRTELIWAFVAFVVVIVTGILKGALVSVLISMLTLIAQANHPPVYVVARKPGTDVFRPQVAHPDDEVYPGLTIARTEGRLYFANISRVIDQLWAIAHQVSPRVLILDCDAIPDIEYTALKSLTEFEKQLKDAGILLWLVALNPEALPVVRRSPLVEKLGDERMYPNLEQAVEAYQRQLEKLDNLGFDR